VGKGGAEFPPDPLSAPAAFRSRSLDGKCLCYSANSRLSKLKNFLFPLKEKVRKTIKRCRDNFSAVLSHYGCLAESLEQNLKIWLWIFFKESSNFAQKTQPSFFSSFYTSKKLLHAGEKWSDCFLQT